jgi:hypothetical protein
MDSSAQPEKHLGELVNETLAADLLCQSVRTLQKWRTSGAGPAYYKFGRSVRYSLVDLNQWLDQRRRFHTSQPTTT